MIEIKITGGMQEVTADLFSLTTQLANGQMALQRMTGSGEAAGTATKPSEAEAPKAKKAKTVEAPKPEAPAVAEQPAATEDVFDDDLIDETPEAKPLPTTVEELRDLASGAVKNVGPAPINTIISKYGTKLSAIPADKYAEVAKEIYKVLREAEAQ